MIINEHLCETWRHLLDDLGPLYHSYEVFGVHNPQLDGIFVPNQKAKAPILQAYIQLAIAKALMQESKSRVLQNFFALTVITRCSREDSGPLLRSESTTIATVS